MLNGETQGNGYRGEANSCSQLASLKRSEEALEFNCSGCVVHPTAPMGLG
jgi:hypothetical protein